MCLVRKDIAKGIMLITQVGISMLTPVCLCLIAGSLLDQLFGTYPVLMLLFTVIGVMAGFRSVYMISRDMYEGQDSYQKTSVQTNLQTEEEDND